MHVFQAINITSSGTFNLKKRFGVLGRVTINKSDAHSIALYDGLDATGKLLATLVASVAEGTYHYEIACALGVTVVTASGFAGDITVSFI